jgi:hypothetical protein
VRASDLTEDDIGRSFLVPCTTGGSDRRRIVYEGTTHRPGGDAYWIILRSAPIRGVMWFRTPAGQVFSGVVCRSSAEVFPLEIDWAVTADGDIVETAVRAA